MDNLIAIDLYAVPQPTRAFIEQTVKTELSGAS